MSHLADWDTSFRSSQRLDSGPVGLGSRFGAEIGAGGLTRELLLEIVECDRPWRVVMKRAGEGFTTREGIGIEPGERRGSRVRYAPSFETDEPDLVDAAGGPPFALIGMAAMAGLGRSLST